MPANPLYIDGHLDLAYIAMQGVCLESPSPDRDRHGVNLPALRAGGVALSLATIFTERGADAPWGYPANDDGSAAARAGRLQLRVYQGLEARGAIRIVRRRADLGAVGDGGPMHVVLLMECADPIESPAHAADPSSLAG